MTPRGCTARQGCPCCGLGRSAAQSVGESRGHFSDDVPDVTDMVVETVDESLAGGVQRDMFEQVTAKAAEFNHT